MNLPKGFGLEWENRKIYLRLRNDICISLLHTLVYIYLFIDRYIATSHLFKCHSL